MSDLPNKSAANAVDEQVYERAQEVIAEKAKRKWQSFLSKEEIVFAQKRMQLEGRRERQPYTRSKIWKIFSSWHIYMLTLLYIFFNNASANAQPIFQQFLKKSTEPRYTITQINAYPTTTNAVAVVTTLVYAWTSDGLFKGARWPPIIFGACMNILCYVSLAVWDIPVGWKWACYILTGCGNGLSGLIFAWAHEICASDNEERAIVAATMNELAYVVQAWLPLLVWQQVDAPEYQKGFITVTCLSVCIIITALGTRSLHKREIRREKEVIRSESEGYETGVQTPPQQTVDVQVEGKAYV